MRVHFSYRALVFLVLLGLAIPALFACASSVPTASPSSQVSSPGEPPTVTPIPTPVVAPEIDFPPDPAPAPSADIDATVTAMVAATVAAMPTATTELPVTVVSAADVISAEVSAPGGTPSPSAAPDFVVDNGTPVDGTVLAEAGAREDPSASSDEGGPEVPVPTLSTHEDSGGSTAVSVTGSESEAEPGPNPEPESRPEPAPSPTSPVEPTAVPEPTPVPEPTSTPRLGSRANPVPLGAVGEVRDSRTRWEIGVEDIIPDAWDLIRERNQFNDPPGEGKQFYLLRLSVKNVGEQRKFFVPYVKAVGEAKALGYTTSGDSCGVTPGSNSREVFPGGQFSLNVCWRIFSADLPTLVMYWDEWPTPQAMWFDLR